MTDTISLSELHLLPADAYPGLLDRWCGPVLALDNRENGCHLGNFGLPEDEDGTSFYFIQSSAYRMPTTDVLLDLRRPECAHRVRDVLAAGVVCRTCQGCGGSNEDGNCPDCLGQPGNGYLIAPADLGWTRDLPPWQAATILAASVLRLAAGEEPVQQDVLPPWRGKPYAQFADSRGYSGDVSIGRLDRDVYTRQWFGLGERGPRTNDDTADRATADVAALRAGAVLDNDDHILVPLTGGKVARVEAP